MPLNWRRWNVGISRTEVGLQLALKWKIWTSTQVSENVRAQVQFPSHRRHRVSVRGRLGQWLYQHFGVSSASLAFLPTGLPRWRKWRISEPSLGIFWAPFSPNRARRGRVCGPGPSARRIAALQEIVRKCDRNAKRRSTSKHLNFGP